MQKKFETFWISALSVLCVSCVCEHMFVCVCACVWVRASILACTPYIHGSKCAHVQARLQYVYTYTLDIHIIFSAEY